MAGRKSKSMNIGGNDVTEVDCKHLTMCFEIYSDNGKDGNVTKDNFTETLQSCSSRCLMTEIKEHESSNGGPPFNLKAAKDAYSSDGFLNRTWAKEAENIPGLDPKVAEDPFLQIEWAIKLLSDTIGENGFIDMSEFSYLLTSVGEEMSQDEVEELMKSIKQPTKGKFDVRRLLKEYATLGNKIGIYDDAVLADVDARCEKIPAPPKK